MAKPIEYSKVINLFLKEGFLISPFYSLELFIQLGISFLFSLPFTFLLFSNICKAALDNHFASYKLSGGQFWSSSRVHHFLSAPRWPMAAARPWSPLLLGIIQHQLQPPQTPFTALPAGLCLNSWPHVDGHWTASEVLNTEHKDQKWDNQGPRHIIQPR